MPLLQLKPLYGAVEPKMPDLVFTHDPQWEDALSGFNTGRVLEWMKTKDVSGIGTSLFILN